MLFCSTKNAGNMLDKNNRKKLLDSLNIDFCNLITAEQIHGSNVQIVGSGDKGKIIKNTDGLITEAGGIPIGVYTADCVPVFLADKDLKKIGIIHTGRQGLAKNIIEKSITKFDLAKENIIVSLGPHICGQCYTVDRSIGRIFPESYRNKRLDLAGEIKRRLLSLGIRSKNILISKNKSKSKSKSKYCTCHQPDLFFSYRHGDKQSRMLSVIMLKK